LIKTSATLLAIPLAASLLLAGCSSDPKPSASASASTTPRPASTPTATASPSASPTRPTDPNIPPAARAHTPAGAAALVKYFHEQLNVAWGRPSAGLLAPLSLPSCKTCSTLESTAANMVPKHERVLGDTVRIDSVDPGATEPNGDQTVVITGAQLKTTVVDASGKKLREIPADRLRLLATARWAPSGWLISEIKVIK
jgi:hypothetical protein